MSLRFLRGDERLNGVRRIVALWVLVWASLPASSSEALDWSVGGNGRLDIAWLHDVDFIDGPVNDEVAATLALRGMAGMTSAQLALAFDLTLGATNPGGFLFAAHLRPLGGALKAGRWFRFSSTAGVGTLGVAPLITFFARFPVDALFEIPIGEHLQLELAAEAAWYPDAVEREARDAAWTDDLSGALRLRYGDRDESSSFQTSRGYFLGVVLEERYGSVLVGAVLGHSLDAEKQ